jgi:endonuclease-3
MAAQSKAQLLTDAHSLLKKRYKPEPRAARLSVLEAVIYAICHEGTTREQANQALSRFKDEFFDWNEVRVSTVEQIQGVLAGLPEPEARAQRLRRFLRQLFEKTYGFTLDALLKKPLKEAVKTLQEYEALHSDYVLSSVIRDALGGHAVPIDGPARRAFERLGIAEPETETATIRGIVERAVPKNRGAEFSDLIEELAHDTCVAGIPDCPRCELRKICPTGQERLNADKVAARAATKAASTKATEKSKPASPAPTPPKAKAESSKPPAAKPTASAAETKKPPKASPKADKPSRPKPPSTNSSPTPPSSKRKGGSAK